MSSFIRYTYKVGMVILALSLGFSCVSQKKLNYVQESSEMTVQQQDNMYFIDEPIDNTIRQGDELYIQVTSADENETSFNQNGSGGSVIRDPSIISYGVDSDGNIKLPYVNKIKMEGLTLTEASDYIEEELSQYLLYPSVFIRFVNNKVTILGEVNRPGVYVFNYKSINILQAIGYANDIGVFGNRSEVLIVREEGDHRSRHYIDLTSDELLASEFYMIHSNDVIYVEPLKSKKWGMDTFPYELLLSIISLSIVTMTFVITYLK